MLPRIKGIIPTLYIASNILVLLKYNPSNSFGVFCQIIVKPYVKNALLNIRKPINNVTNVEKIIASDFILSTFLFSILVKIKQNTKDTMNKNDKGCIIGSKTDVVMKEIK